MNKFIIVDGLPFLYANGKAYRVRWDDKGFTVGAEVELTSVPSVTYSEISIKAKCAGHLDSIQETNPDEEQEAGQETNPDEEQEAGQETNPDEEQEAGQETNPDEESVPGIRDGMKLEELKQYASDNGISLKGARTKTEILEAINNASKE